jgi:hypothetical protein
MVQDPMCQSTQVQQSPQPSRVVILDEEYHHDKKLAQKEN